MLYLFFNLFIQDKINILIVIYLVITLYTIFKQFHLIENFNNQNENETENETRTNNNENDNDNENDNENQNEDNINDEKSVTEI